VIIGGRVRIDGRVIIIRGAWKDSGFCWKESGFVERNQVLLEGIRFDWKESGFVGCVVNMA
jgi:hypothetical protein